MLSAALISCTSENTETPDQAESLSVECYSRSGDSNTKSLVKDFAMYVFSGSGNYEGVSNPVHVTYSDKWDFPSITLREPAQIHAFYPYTDNMDYTAIPLSLTPQTDYLTSVGAVTADKTNPSISIVMEHILSKINVTINSSANCKVNSFFGSGNRLYNLRSNNLLTKAEVDVTSSTSSVLMFPTKERSTDRDENKLRGKDLLIQGKCQEIREWKSLYLRAQNQRQQRACNYRRCGYHRLEGRRQL